MLRFIALISLLSTACGTQSPPVQARVVHQFQTQWAPSGKASITSFARGKSAFVGKLWLAAGANVPKHQDPTEETLIVQSGSGHITVDGVVFEVGPGHVIFMPAGATVQFKNGDQPFEAIQVFAGPASADKYRAWGEKPD
jgi:quercetin dioxygenase-like cupin family protein